MKTRFSIIVPTRDRGALLDQCLGALGGLDYERENFDVLVVDDGSREPMDAVGARHAATLRLTLLRTEGVGPARARNLALAQATGDYVVFTDDDCQPHAQWLEAYDRAAKEHPGAGFGGSIVDADANNIYGRTSQILVTYLYEYNETHDALNFFCSNNFAFPREALAAMGGFDESFPLAAGEDRYLCTRWLRHAPLLYVADATISHRQFFGFRGYWRQHFRYGRGAHHFWQRRLADDGAVNQVQPLSFYTDMLLFPFKREPFFRALGMSALLVLSQVAMILGYRSEVANSKGTAAPQGPVSGAEQKGVR